MRAVYLGALSYRRTVVTALALLGLLAAVVGVRQRIAEPSPVGLATNDDTVGPSSDGDQATTQASSDRAVVRAGDSPATSVARGKSPRAIASALPGRRTIPPGVTSTEIRVAYYWKGDRTKTSPYLRGTGQEGNVDEAESFRALVDYINKHSGDGAELMGVRFNLHGRKLVPIVLDAGQYPDTYAATAETLVKETKPFAAISAHGSLSSYICPALARAGIHNISTYDLAGDLGSRTNGYCLPFGMSWERQVEYSKAYLVKHKSTPYSAAGASRKRVYGFLFTEYPGLVDSARSVIDEFKAAGVPIAAQATMAADLATAQQQTPGIVAKFRAAGVNTLIIPDAGTPLNFTHGAQASGYNPDYYVWPCSGQDTSGMVRLYNAAQWSRASGLTCYDYEFNPDLTNDARARRTEWYRQYQDVRPDAEPPAPTPMVYQSLAQLLVGVTNAGRDLTVESFRAGLDAFGGYRYDAVEGVTNDASNMLLAVGSPDRSPIGDVAKVRWTNGERTSGNVAQGTYVYPEKQRYARGARF